MQQIRAPYVGAGEDGARRSAEIDRSEMDTLDRDDPRWNDLHLSAQRWEEQADAIAYQFQEQAQLVGEMAHRLADSRSEYASQSAYVALLRENVEMLLSWVEERRNQTLDKG